MVGKLKVGVIFGIFKKQLLLIIFGMSGYESVIADKLVVWIPLFAMMSPPPEMPSTPVVIFPVVVVILKVDRTKSLVAVPSQLAPVYACVCKPFPNQGRSQDPAELVQEYGGFGGFQQTPLGRPPGGGAAPRVLACINTAKKLTLR